MPRLILGSYQKIILELISGSKILGLIQFYCRIHVLCYLLDISKQSHKAIYNIKK